MKKLNYSGTTKEHNLRALSSGDLPMLLAWRNDLWVRRSMETQHEITPDEHQAWFNRSSRDATRALLIVSEGFNPMGFAQLRGVSEGGIAQWGFYAKPGSPKGTGRVICGLVLDYAFHERKLHKVWGQVFEENQTSIALHLKLGFQREGLLREHKVLNGTYHSMVCFGLLFGEWTPKRGDGDQYGEKHND